jgi:M6 family metalloprotease-like protein
MSRGRTCGWGGPAVGLAIAALALPGHAIAQDIEAVSALSGVPLPAAYYETVRSDPTAYTFSRAFFARTGPAAAGVAGAVRIPVVLGLFSDSADPDITRDMVQASLFDGPAVHGTLTAAYLEMSRGALSVGGDVFDWVRTGYSLSEAVGTSDGLGGDGLVGEYFAEALDSLDASVDFTIYDNDGPDGLPNSGDDDGYVDVVTFEYLEVAASCGGPAIWPHRWRMSAWNGSAYVTDDIGTAGDTIRINDYITQGVTDCTGTGVQNAAIIAHEFGHALGLPDYYHWVDRAAGPQGRRWVLGCWSLMAAGSWGCGPVEDAPPLFGPTHLTALSKEQLGWAQYVDPGEVWSEEIVLSPMRESGVALRVPLDASGTEFLIAEYREQTGFDSALPADGVLFYKQDASASRAPNPTGSDPYYLSLLEQDGNSGLLRTFFEGGNRGEAGDAWGVGGVSGKLHAESLTPLLLSSGNATSVTVHEVSVQAGRARIVISTSSLPKLIAPSGPIEVAQVVSFLESIRIAGGRMPFTAMGTVPQGLVVSTEGDQLVVTGSLTDPGPVELFLWVRDSYGEPSEPIAVSLSAPVEWSVPLEELLRPFLEDEGESLTTQELLYLDDWGNRNGLYDVGDLRKWLRDSSP